jgi:uncharacterized short protein YbdD (DUF466 family)
MLKQFWKGLKQTVLLMIGIPDYQQYVRHRQDHHPGEKVMSYEEFFRNRQEGRYGDGKMGRCC